ncbi:MAG: LexA family transcriptional regulator [Magnetococcales bacterium]|nr:LexA family transcriptional regulator [Magnetococcales bacterium]MBF0114852.1 LexA family transcriptional regulator [Magnetococcales bacterium]
MDNFSLNQAFDPDFHDRLAQVIGDEEPYPWAERIGIGKSTFAGMWRNRAMPQTKTLLKIAQYTDISINWLLTGRGPQRLDLSRSVDNGRPRHGYLSYVTLPQEMDSSQEGCSNKQQSAAPVEEMGEQYRVHRDEYCHVPCYGMRMGGSQLLQNEQLVDHLSFKVSWIEQVMGLDTQELALVQVTGDSMEPTLKEGDLLLLDRRGFTPEARHKPAGSDAIYVLLRGQELIAKRLQFGFDGSLTIQSDNAAYAAQTVAAEQTQRVVIVGRVVWVGRRA